MNFRVFHPLWWRLLGFLWLFPLLLGLPSALRAQTPDGGASPLLERALEQVEHEKQDAELQRRLTLSEIRECRQTAQAAEAAAQARVAELKRRIAGRERELEELAQRQQELEQKSRLALHQLNELAGVVRTSGRDQLSLLENSPVSGDRRGRLLPLRELLERSAYPGMAEIRAIAELYLEEIEAGGRIHAATGEFISLDGQRTQGRVVRLGALTTIYRDDAGKSCGFAVYGPENDARLAVSKPGWRVAANLKKFIAGETTSVYLDFSGGDAVRRLALTPNAWERLRSGGILVWPILLVGLVALVFSLERFLFLGRVKSNTDRVMGQIIALVNAGDFQRCLDLLKNRQGPVFRVLTAGLGARRADREVLENVMEEAILKELPRLEKFLPTLQVLAAIAPLLGLLGTVTGMINTFQVITIYGAGDPRMMSGGISEALITTKLGLMVAIPIILLHTWFSRRVDAIIGDMEEKTVSLSLALRREDERSRTDV
ncbi:MAG: DUF3450 family protein [Deltaproteobacteria bacterium]|nr:DUF3450 family protein [Deltaproteobacteria bacterium]